MASASGTGVRKTAVKPASVFWDNGSTVCLCTHRWAKARGFTGVPKPFFLKVVDKMHERVESRMDEFDVVENDAEDRGGEMFVDVIVIAIGPVAAPASFKMTWAWW